MDRRRFLAGAGALLASPAPSGLIKPKALQPGDTVGLITPSTYVSDPDRLQLAARTIKYFGLKMKTGKNVGKRAGYVGGSVAERLEDLHQMFRDPEVKAVFAIRGGYGSEHLLDGIDYGLIRRNPKIFLGYSDITALHLAIQKKAGLVTFHGPVVLSRFSAYTQALFRRPVAGRMAPRSGGLMDPLPIRLSGPYGCCWRMRRRARLATDGLGRTPTSALRARAQLKRGLCPPRKNTT